MELSRNEYPSMLDALQPTQAVSILNERLKLVSRVNNEMADWFQERRRIEDQYVSALRRLAQKEPPDSSSELGIFTTPWQKIVNSATSFAESHYSLSQRIETDIEKPLRSFATNNKELQNMSNMQGNLQSLARDYEAAQKKTEKLKGRSAANKAAMASSEMEIASSQWTSQAPYVFEALQAIDESRCNHLRDTLTQFQTHELDMIEKGRKIAESTLNAILNIETPNEISTFAARHTDGSIADTRRRFERRQSRSLTNTSLTAPVSSPGPEDLANQPSASIQEEKKSRLGGLKRLGTVMRRKSTQPSAFNQRPSTGKLSSSNLGQTASPNGEEPEIAREATTSLSLNEWQLPAAGLGVQPVMAPLQDQIAAEDTPSAREVPLARTTTNGAPYESGTAQLPEPVIPTVESSTWPPPTVPQEVILDTKEYSIPQATDDPISLAEQEAASSSDQATSQLKVDIRSAPITEDTSAADSAMANMASTLRAQAAPPRRSGTNRGRRDVRSSLYTQSMALDSSIEEQESTPPRTFGDYPLAQAASAASFPSERIVPSSSIVPLKATPPPPTLLPAVANRSMSEDRTGSDTQSIVSSISAGNALRHPVTREPGLNSSIIETVSAWIEKGIVTRALVVGEVALACNAITTSESPGNGNLRLNNFSSLDKLAPNPAFISEMRNNAQPGEYAVDLGTLSQWGGIPTTAFKYQVHVSDENARYQAPIILLPSWRVEEKQISVILAYSLNPTFSMPVTLSNITLVIHLETNELGTGKATTCQSRPAGTFSKERNLVFWRLDELVLTPGATEQKMVARFATEGQAKPGKVEAKWEIHGESATAMGLGSGLDVSHLDAAESSSDPFADENASSAWKTLQSSRRIISGVYTAV